MAILDILQDTQIIDVNVFENYLKNADELSGILYAMIEIHYVLFTFINIRSVKTTSGSISFPLREMIKIVDKSGRWPGGSCNYIGTFHQILAC